LLDHPILGDAFSDRDAAARAFDRLLPRDIPRDPATWPDVSAQPVPEYQVSKVELNQALSDVGNVIGLGIIEHAKRSGHPLPAEFTDPTHPATAQQILDFIYGIAAHYFPRRTPAGTEDAQRRG
jgi:hypothetical protein